MSKAELSKELLLNAITREYRRLKISHTTFEYIVYNRFGDKGFPLTSLEPQELESFIMQLRSF